MGWVVLGVWIGAVVLAREFIPFGAQPRDDALGIHQSLGTPERNKADFWRGGLLHFKLSGWLWRQLALIRGNYKFGDVCAGKLKRSIIKQPYIMPIFWSIAFQSGSTMHASGRPDAASQYM